MQLTDALLSHSPEAIRAIPKSDLHNHAGRGGSIQTLSAWTGVRIEPPTERFRGLADMQVWFDQNVKAHCPGGFDGYRMRLAASFAQANDDGIAVLALSFAIDEVEAFGGMGAFMRAVEDMRRQYAPAVRFLPELCFDRGRDTAWIASWLDEVLSYRYFASVDIGGEEFAQPIGNFRRVYEIAEGYGVRRKAHVGEFGSADDVTRAVETLHLHEVHHGIAAARSKEAMRFLAEHGIRLNVCPTSNIMLGLAEDYRSHPIATLARNGVTVTINTDDLLIFNSGVSEEYCKLHRAGALTAEELERIRLTGLAIVPA